MLKIFKIEDKKNLEERVQTFTLAYSQEIMMSLFEKKSMRDLSLKDMLKLSGYSDEEINQLISSESRDILPIYVACLNAMSTYTNSDEVSLPVLQEDELILLEKLAMEYKMLSIEYCSSDIYLEQVNYERKDDGIYREGIRFNESVLRRAYVQWIVLNMFDAILLLPTTMELYKNRTCRP